MTSNDSDFAAAVPKPNFQAQKSGVAYCPGYTDADGNWNNGFQCRRWGGPDEDYCCGDEKGRFCCPEKSAGEARGQTHPTHHDSAAGGVGPKGGQKTSTKSKSQQKSDHGDSSSDKSSQVKFDTKGQIVTPPFVRNHSDGGGVTAGGTKGLLDSLGHLTGNPNFPIIPAIAAFTITTFLLLIVAILIGCYFCPGCPGTKKRRKLNESQNSKFIKTTSVNLEAEETSAAIAAQALVSVTTGGAGDCNTFSTYVGNPMTPCYSNNSMGKMHNIISGSSSTTSSLHRGGGCADFSCRGTGGRQDSLSDQISTITPGCFHHKNSCSASKAMRGNGQQHMHLQQHITEQLIDSASSLGMAGSFIRNSPSTTTTSSSDGLVDQRILAGQTYQRLGNVAAASGAASLHCGCELRGGPQSAGGGMPTSMDVEGFVTAMYQNNQNMEMNWKPELENLLNMSSLSQDMTAYSAIADLKCSANGEIHNSQVQTTKVPLGMDDNSIKKWLSTTNQQLTPKRNFFAKPKCAFHSDGGANESVTHPLLGDLMSQSGQGHMQMIPENSVSTPSTIVPFPDVTQTSSSRGDRETSDDIKDCCDVSGQYKAKPDVTAFAVEESSGLSAIDVPNCPQLKLTSGNWLPKLKYETNMHSLAYNSS